MKGVKMTQEEIIKKIINYLDQHLEGSRGYIGQDPYKKDFFDLCKNAHLNGYFDTRSSPRLTGDALMDILNTRWLTDDEQSEQKKKLMNDFLMMWNEWRYALDNAA
jgi:hypothetical protein